MIRGALYRAAAKAVEDGEEGLYYDEHRHRRSPAPLAWPGTSTRWTPARTPRCGGGPTGHCATVVNLRVYLDLERGWRVTMPNLEQTGLLEIGYLGLDWRRRPRRPVARTPSPRCATRVRRGARAKVCRVLLDEMRRSLAIDAECFAPTSSTGSSWPASRRCAGSGP